jgi:hypothetical protein
MTNRHEFTAEETTRLLDELDARLRRRGAAASIFVVGGAAIAANHTRRGRVTQDIDALTRDTEVLEEAKALARERGLPENWLNPNAGMWMPPLPGGVLDHPGEPGLRVTYADDGFLLATKLVAQRAKDADDVVALAGRLGLGAASPGQLETHIRSHYTDPAALEFIVDGNDVDREIRLLSQDASRMLHRTSGAADARENADAPTVGGGASGSEPAVEPTNQAAQRLPPSTETERRTPTSPPDHQEHPAPGS